MALQIIRNNIVNVSADAIVNTANPLVAVGPGVDHAIYEAAGYDQLLEARRAIGEMAPGQVAYTPAFNLDAKYIIHAIGPAWRGGDYGERETVAKCYRGSLALARELSCESIAFPLLATGTYGFPKDEALRIALNEISTFLLDNEMEVMLVVYDKTSYEVSGKLFSDIKSFIDEKDVVLPKRRRFSKRFKAGGGLADAPEPNLLEESADFYGSFMDEDAIVESKILKEEADAALSFSKNALEDRIAHMDKTFQEYLLMMIDRRGLTDPEVYKKANIDRKHFSKIRSNKDYTPSKKTALALAIALELNLDETKDLLSRAGLALSPSNIFDLIIEYCIMTENYKVHEINSILFEYDQPMLGV
jgi:O-acetyl-ADP-ribose deacetylase (regulator of RNase III)